MADERDDIDIMTTATLVDRTGGPSEFIFDGKRFTFTAAKPARSIPAYIASWLFRADRCRVWATDGSFTFRYGIKDGPDDLLEQLGEEPFETSPIMIDTQRVEGWNTDAVDRGQVQVIPLKRMPADFANQGGGAATFSGKER